jgi:centromere protein J
VPEDAIAFAAATDARFQQPPAQPPAPAEPDAHAQTAPLPGARPPSVSSLLGGSVAVQAVEHTGGKRETRYSCGARVVEFPNGARKIMWKSGQSRADFPNGDWKESHPDGRVVYYYLAAHTLHTTHLNGVQVYQFGDAQTETHFPDGTKEISFSDGTAKYMYANGDSTSVFPNGTRVFQPAGGEPVPLDE